MQNKSHIKIQDIKTIVAKFEQLPRVWDRIHQLMGGKESGQFNQTLVQGDPKDMLTRQQTPAVTLETLESIPDKKPITFVMIDDNVYVTSNVGLKGLNRHLSNPCLYLTLAPEKVNIDLLHMLPEDNQLRDQALIAFGKKQLRETINLIGSKHPNKKVNIIVVGNFVQHRRLIAENWRVYKEDVSLLIDQSIPRGNFDPSYLGIHTQPIVFYINTNNDKTYSSSTWFTQLYSIYLDTLAEGNPVVIHDGDSLSEAPKIAFAFEILKHFDTIFASADSPNIAKQLVSAFNVLRRSFSTDLLSQVQDFKQAVYLAFSLKMVEMEVRCANQLTHYLVSKLKPGVKTLAGVYSQFIDDVAPAGKKIMEIIGQLTILTSPLERHRYLNQQLKEASHSTLWEYQDIRKAFGRPEHSNLLETLDTLFEQRCVLEDGVRRQWKNDLVSDQPVSPPKPSFWNVFSPKRSQGLPSNNTAASSTTAQVAPHETESHQTDLQRLFKLMESDDYRIQFPLHKRTKDIIDLRNSSDCTDRDKQILLTMLKTELTGFIYHDKYRTNIPTLDSMEYYLLIMDLAEELGVDVIFSTEDFNKWAHIYDMEVKPVAEATRTEPDFSRLQEIYQQADLILRTEIAFILTQLRKILAILQQDKPLDITLLKYVIHMLRKIQMESQSKGDYMLLIPSIGKNYGESIKRLPLIEFLLRQLYLEVKNLMEIENPDEAIETLDSLLKKFPPNIQLDASAMDTEKKKLDKFQNGDFKLRNSMRSLVSSRDRFSSSIQTTASRLLEEYERPSAETKEDAPPYYLSKEDIAQMTRRLLELSGSGRAASAPLPSPPEGEESSASSSRTTWNAKSSSNA